MLNTAPKVLPVLPSKTEAAEDVVIANEHPQQDYLRLNAPGTCVLMFDRLDLLQV